MFESVQRYQAEQIRTEKKTKSDRSKGKRDFMKQAFFGKTGRSMEKKATENMKSSRIVQEGLES